MVSEMKEQTRELQKEQSIWNAEREGKNNFGNGILLKAENIKGRLLNIEAGGVEGEDLRNTIPALAGRRVSESRVVGRRRA